MSRLKQYLAMATVLVLPVVAACGEDVMPPPPTGSIVGQVSIEGMGVDGVTVSLSNGASTATAGGGNYRFDTVEQGSYTVTISGYPADASFDANSAPANIGNDGGTVTVDFRGSYIRTASIMGTVTVENMGLAGVAVRLSGMADSETATDDSGQYSFTGLRSGTYSVEISGFDTNEVSFSSTSGAATVGVGESKVVSFDGTYLRTAGVMGQVSADGEGLGGVTVTLMGQGTEATKVTDAGGLYAFSQLRSGDYTVAISGYGTDDYEFETTSKSVTIATGETANVPFEGTLLRTAGIAGRVSVAGMGLDDVEVTLAGAAEASTMTSNGGQYAFAGLAAGTYVVSIGNPNDVAYSFDNTSTNVELADDQSAIVNFEGTHTRTASVSGMLFIDEAPQDKMYTANEPAFAQEGIPLLLQGPGINDVTVGVTGADGSFAFDNLMAGSYRVLVNMTEEVATGLATAGFMFAGDLTGEVVNVAAGMAEQVNFPFRITMQTVATGARMGGGGHYGAPVEGVKLALYARADGTGMLGEATTDEMGMASFTFARADNTGPAGNDNIVFVKVVESGHDALHVSGNEFVEITYASTARVHAADAEKEAATLVNVAVAFDFWIKSNEMARDGDMGLEGWKTMVMMGDDALEMAPDATDKDGKSTFSYTVDPTMLPAMFAVKAGEEDQPDMDEAWEQGDALTHTHTGLELPPGEDDDMLDLGPLRITFTTQAIYVGVHRELDDRTGFTDFIGIGDGDSRPTGTAVDEIEITLMTGDSRGRLRVLEYDHDADSDTPDERAVATAGASGIVSFKNIPADTEITVVADEGSGRVIVPDSRASREIDAFGDQLDDYPDGKIVGAFGDMSGARPDVWLCPLQRQEGECSTYAYKWATGTISGSIDGLRKGDKATVTLTPVNSNEDYEDDLEDEARITAGTGGAAKYSFTGVADGRYMVTLAASPGSWDEDDAKGLSIMHDEDNDEDDYTGDSATGDLSATDLRGVIRGRIANDANDSNNLTSDESRAGVMVALYTAKKVGGSGYVADKAVTDDNGDPVMAETDGDGVYTFEGLMVGGMYLVKPEETDLYTAVRNGNTKIGKPAEDATDVVSHALVEAGLPPAPGSEPAIPMWNYHTSTVATVVGAADFVLLYKDGEVEGEVSDPSVRAAHARTVIELHQCKVSNYALTDSEDPESGGASQCTEYTGVVVSVDVDANGNWGAEDLREGVYEVIPDLPAGYISVNDAGGTEVDEENNTLHTQQFVELMGGRADDDTETFHIKDRNAGDGAELDGVEVGGEPCSFAPSPTNANPQCGHSEDGSFEVVVTASAGAMVRLSSSAMDAAPHSPGYSQAATNGKTTEVTLPKAGTRTYYVHVTAEDGYASNMASSAGFSIRRDADVRVKTVRLSWAGDRIDLNRDELGLDPDGETDPVTGTTALRVTVDEGDNGAKVPATALTVEATSMTSGFGVVAWSPANADGTCPVPDPNSAGANEVTVGGTSGDDDRICFRITDSDGADADPDENKDNTRDYLLIVTRK